MRKILFLLCAIALAFTALPLRAERIEVPKALFSLDLPAHEYWQIQPASKFPNAVDSMCFPRFRRGGTTLSAGLWEYEPRTLDGQIEAYFKRMNEFAGNAYTKEISRQHTYTKSGVTIVRLLVETGPGDGTHWQLIRYIFQNRAGVFVCISAAGDFSVTDNTVLGTLELMTVN